MKKGITEPRAHYVTVAYHAEQDVVSHSVTVRSNEELVRTELRTAVKVDRCGCLVRTEGNDFFTPAEMAASTTFRAPRMLVFTTSKGLYSAAGTCFNAGAWG